MNFTICKIWSFLWAFRCFQIPVRSYFVSYTVFLPNKIFENRPYKISKFPNKDIFENGAFQTFRKLSDLFPKLLFKVSVIYKVVLSL